MRERETDRQTDRDRERDTDRQRQRQRERERDQTLPVLCDCCSKYCCPLAWFDCPSPLSGTHSPTRTWRVLCHPCSAVTSSKLHGSHPIWISFWKHFEWWLQSHVPTIVTYTCMHQEQAHWSCLSSAANGFSGKLRLQQNLTTIITDYPLLTFVVRSQHKGSNERWFILTWTHSMHILGEIAFIKPQNNT